MASTNLEVLDMSFTCPLINDDSVQLFGSLVRSWFPDEVSRFVAMDDGQVSLDTTRLARCLPVQLQTAIAGLTDCHFSRTQWLRLITRLLPNLTLLIEGMPLVVELVEKTLLSHQMGAFDQKQYEKVVAALIQRFGLKFQNKGAIKLGEEYDIDAALGEVERMTGVLYGQEGIGFKPPCTSTPLDSKPGFLSKLRSGLRRSKSRDSLDKISQSVSADRIPPIARASASYTPASASGAQLHLQPKYQDPLMGTASQFPSARLVGPTDLLQHTGSPPSYKASVKIPLAPSAPTVASAQAGIANSLAASSHQVTEDGSPDTSVSARNFGKKLSGESVTWQSILGGSGPGQSLKLRFTDLKPAPFTGTSADYSDFATFANDFRVWIASLNSQRNTNLSDPELLTLLRLSLAGAARKYFDSQSFRNITDALSSLQREHSTIHRSFEAALNVFANFTYDPALSVSANSRTLLDVATVLDLPDTLVRRKLVDSLPYPKIQENLRMQKFQDMPQLVEKAQFLIDVLQGEPSGQIRSCMQEDLQLETVLSLKSLEKSFGEFYKNQLQANDQYNQQLMYLNSRAQEDYSYNDSYEPQTERYEYESDSYERQSRPARARGRQFYDSTRSPGRQNYDSRRPDQRYRGQGNNSGFRSSRGRPFSGQRGQYTDSYNAPDGQRSHYQSGRRDDAQGGRNHRGRSPGQRSPVDRNVSFEQNKRSPSDDHQSQASQVNTLTSDQEYSFQQP